MVPIEKMQGQKGMATVRVVKGKVRVQFEKEDKIHDLFLEDCPEGIKDGKYYVGMSGDYARVMFVAPPDGDSYLIQFIGFARDGGGGILAPKLLKGGKIAKSKDGRGEYTTQDRFVSWAVYKVVEGEYKGWLCRMQVPYAWKPFGEEAGIGGSGKQRLEEWLKKMGMDLETTTIPYSDNLLPVIEGLLLLKKKVFTAELSSGFINNLAAVPANLLKSLVESEGTSDDLVDIDMSEG